MRTVRKTFKFVSVFRPVSEKTGQRRSFVHKRVVFPNSLRQVDVAVVQDDKTYTQCLQCIVSSKSERGSRILDLKIVKMLHNYRVPENITKYERLYVCENNKNHETTQMHFWPRKLLSFPSKFLFSIIFLIHRITMHRSHLRRACLNLYLETNVFGTRFNLNTGMRTRP